MIGGLKLMFTQGFNLTSLHVGGIVVEQPIHISIPRPPPFKNVWIAFGDSPQERASHQPQQSFGTPLGPSQLPNSLKINLQLHVLTDL